MINLIPPEGHIAMKREYVLRVGATFCLLLSGVLVLLTAALVPTYVLISAQLKAHEVGPITDEKRDEVAQANGEVARMRDVLAQLSTSTQDIAASEIIQEVSRYAPQTITFKTFRIDAPKGTVQSIQVQGVATTREVLAKFKNDLEGSPMFDKAQIPLSDLAKESDLPFVVTITLSKKS